MTTATEILESARALVSPPGTWIQKDIAKDAAGDGISAFNPDAVCFCMMGAIHRAAFDKGIKRFDPARADAIHALKFVVQGEGFSSIPDFNDAKKRTQREVLQAFDTAIATLGD
jgi:hypothetical protein